MSMYDPDVWAVIRFTGADVPDGELYKILAGWHGGFADSDHWKINSGITQIEQQGDWYLIGGYSGSVYRCHKNAERTNGLTQSIFDQYQRGYAAQGRAVTMQIVTIDSIPFEIKHLADPVSS